MATSDTQNWLENSAGSGRYDPRGGTDPHRREAVLRSLYHMGSPYVTSSRIMQFSDVDIPATRQGVSVELRELSKHGFLEVWNSGYPKTYRVWELPTFQPGTETRSLEEVQEFDPDEGWPPEPPESVDTIETAKEILYCLYWRKGLSLPEVGNHLGYSREFVRDLMEKFGIPRRETVKRLGQGPATIPKGYLSSEERRERMQNQCGFINEYEPTGGSDRERRVDVLNALRDFDNEYVSCRDLKDKVPHSASGISLELQELHKHGFLEVFSNGARIRYRIHSIPRITPSQARKAFVWEFRDADVPTIPDASRQTPDPDEVSASDGRVPGADADDEEDDSDESPYTVEPPAYKDKDKLYELYWGEQISMEDIAERLGTRYGNIINYMNEFGIPRRGRAAKVWDGESIPPGFELESA